jgi:hypothetical protein
MDASLVEVVARAIAEAQNPGLFEGNESQQRSAALPYGVPYSQEIELKIARISAVAAIAAIERSECKGT